MKLQKTAQGTIIEIIVKPNSKQFQVKTEGDELVVFCHEAPVKGKVNRELIKQLSKLFKKRVEIISGFTSKQKKILIADVSTEKVNKMLGKLQV